MKKLLLIIALAVATLARGAVSVGDFKISQATNASPVVYADRIITPVSGTSFTTNAGFKTALGLGLLDTPGFAGLSLSGNVTFSDTGEGLSFHGGGTMTGASGNLTLTPFANTNKINFGTAALFHFSQYSPFGSFVIEGTGLHIYDNTSSPIPQAAVTVGSGPAANAHAAFVLYDRGAPADHHFWEMSMRENSGNLYILQGTSVGAANGRALELRANADDVMARLNNPSTSANSYTLSYWGTSSSEIDVVAGAVGTNNSAYGGGRSMVLGTNASTPVVFITGGTERARLASTGLTLTGNLTFGSSGSVLNGTTGSIGITATGTNQSITLAPTGSGRLLVKSGSGATNNTRFVTNDYVDSTTGSTIGMAFGAASGNTHAILNVGNSGGTTAGTLAINSNGGSVLVGTTTSASNGVVQILQSTLGSGVMSVTSSATNDDPVEVVEQNRAATTDATATTLHTVTIAATKTYTIEVTVVARRTGGTAGTAEDGAGYKRIASVKNVAGTATLIGAVTAVSTQEDQAGWDCTIDVTSNTARVRVTGATDNNVTWHVTARVYSVGS